MNISISKEENSPTKQDANTRDGNINKASSSSSPWLRLKDPRIVRVSRAFGGKDRHSKVCTIRGLRDRRVRLSVPTAIQLYDLQDRLGLNQPSKVVDWLLNAAKQEIDELPPLPIEPMNFALNHQEIGASSHSNLGDRGFWNSDSTLRDKPKQVARDSTNIVEEEKWTKRSENGDQQESNEGQLGNNCSSSGLLPYGTSYYQLEHSNFTSSHLAGFSSQSSDHDLQNLNDLALPPSALSLSSGSQIFVPHPYFPAHNLGSSVDSDPRQINHFQMFSSSTQNLFPYSMNDQSSGSSRGFHRLFNSNSEGNQTADKDHQDFPCK